MAITSLIMDRFSKFKKLPAAQKLLSSEKCYKQVPKSGNIVDKVFYSVYLLFSFTRVGGGNNMLHVL